MYRSRISTVHPFSSSGDTLKFSTGCLCQANRVAPEAAIGPPWKAPEPRVMPCIRLFIGGRRPPMVMLLRPLHAPRIQLERGFHVQARRSGRPQRLGPPFLLYLGRAADDLAIKTARGLAYWRPEWCIGQYRSPGSHVTLGLPDMDPAQARAAGAKTMVVGTANAGGVMGREIVADILTALNSDLNVVAGLHQKLRENADIVAAAKRNGRALFDAREWTQRIPVGTGRKRAGRRLLTVGTDCSVGKMYTTLALERSMRKRGLTADF